MSSKHMCAIVEPRNHCALENVIENVASALTCTVLLFHGTDNSELARGIQKRIGEDKVKLQALSVTNLAAEEYSDLLLSSSFWKQLQAHDVDQTDRVLIFQTDAGLCASSGRPLVDAILESAWAYEYCGAPWPNPGAGVGNGGFSTRSISEKLLNGVDLHDVNGTR